MRRARVFLAGPAAPGEEVALPEAARRHLVQVLRLRPGDRLSGGAPDGVEWELELLSAESARVIGGRRPDVEPRAAVTLALAAPRGGRMDWVVEKAVEIGVGAIQPLLAERSALGEPGTGRQERWGRLAEAAARQSRRLVVPEVRAPTSLLEAVQAAPCPCLIAHPAGGASVAEAVAAGPSSDGVLVAVGPEGGWTEGELASAVAAGAVPVGLGPRILRVETAALVMLTLALAALGELS